MPRVSSDNNLLIRRRATVNRVKLEISAMIISAFLIVLITIGALIRKRIPIYLHEQYCSKSSDTHMEEITASTLSPNGSRLSDNGVNYPGGTFWESENGTIWGCPCLFKPCLYVCCRKNFSENYKPEKIYRKEGAECVNNNLFFYSNLSNIYSSTEKNSLKIVNITDDHFYTITGKDTCEGRGKYELEDNEKSNTYILDDGSLYTPGSLYGIRKNTDFCVETLESSVNQILMCFISSGFDEPAWKFRVRLIGMMITIPCLIVVLVTLSVLPHLAFPYGNALNCYIGTLAVAFSLMSFPHLIPYYPTGLLCSILDSIMRRPVARPIATKDSSGIKGKRRLEIIGFLVSAGFIVALSVCFMLYNRIVQQGTSTTCQEDSGTYMVDLTRSDPLVNGSILAEDGILYTPESYWTSDNGSIWGCPCVMKPCIHKCCVEGEGLMLVEDYYDGEKEYYKDCGRNNSYFDQRMSTVYSIYNSNGTEEKEIGADHFYVIVGHHICGKRGKRALDEEEKSYTFLMEDGHLLTKRRSQWVWLNYSEFCVESSPTPSNNDLLLCLSEQTKNATPEWRFHVRGVGMLISVPCLLLTMVTYCLLPQLFNLHGKALICHVTSLLVAYSCLGFILLTSVKLQEHVVFCHATAFVIQFFILAAFFWLNALCFDIWWVFSGLMPLRGSQKSAEHYKFLLYSLYAWGCPLAIVLLTALAEYTPGLPEFLIKPEIGVTSCFFNGREATLLYLYLPLGVLVYLNTVMFIITTMRFTVHSRSVRQLQRGDSRRHIRGGRSTSDVQRFNLYLKLSIMMGLNWALEIVNFLVNSQSLFWIIPELFNVLQGILYLQQFVCQRRILRMLNMKLCPSRRLVAPEDSNKNISSARSTSSNRRPTFTETTAVLSTDPEPSDIEHSAL